MKKFFFLLFLGIQIIFNFPELEVFNIIMNDNITQMQRTSHKFKPKGLLLTFDPNSNISKIPWQIEFEISNGFYSVIEGSEPFEIQKENGYKALVSGFYIDYCFPAVNFILADKAITIPSKYLFKKNQYYEFIFLFHEKQEKIVIGKDLIDLMNVEFVSDNDFIIHNKEFVIKVKD